MNVFFSHVKTFFPPSIMISFCLLSIFSSIYSFIFSAPIFFWSAGTILAAVYFHWTECLALNALHNARPPKHTHTKIPHGSFIVNCWKHVMLENLLTSPKYELGMKEATLMGTFLFQKAHKAR